MAAIKDNHGAQVIKRKTIKYPTYLTFVGPNKPLGFLENKKSGS